MSKVKMKTHKGTAKRIKITGRGKLRHHKSGRRHLMTNKSPKRTRSLRKTAAVPPSQEKSLRRLLPYQ